MGNIDSTVDDLISLTEAMRTVAHSGEPLRIELGDGRVLTISPCTEPETGNITGLAHPCYDEALHESARILKEVRSQNAA